MAEIPDPGDFAGLRFRKQNVMCVPYLEKDGRIHCTCPRLIACWAHAAWTVKALELDGQLITRVGVPQAIKNAALCLRIAQNGE